MLNEKELCKKLIEYIQTTDVTDSDTVLNGMILALINVIGCTSPDLKEMGNTIDGVVENIKINRPLYLKSFESYFRKKT